LKEIKSGIYQIVNLMDGKFYIGSTTDFKRRKRSHFSELNLKIHKNKHLIYAYNIYGKENFKFEILEYIKDKTKLVEHEQWWLNLFFDNCKTCYNVQPIAGSTLGYNHTEETKQKMSKTRKGKRLSEETKIKIGLKSQGRKHTKESKKKMSEIKKGKKYSEETKRKVSEANKGRKHNEEAKLKMAISSGAKLFLVYTTKGDFIGKWINQRECAKELKVDYRSVNNCLKGRRLKCNDYVFIFVEEYSEKKLKKIYCEIEKCKIKLTSKIFNVYEKKTNKQIGTYNNQNKCARELGLNTGGINSCLQGRCKSTGGYIFKYVS
jgi:group I intron endonuclease